MGKLNYRIPNTNDFREIYVKVTDTLPIGAVCQYGGSTAPSGYLMCNGQAVSRTIYADLFKAIGTSFGAGDGVTTFNVPNFNGRVPVGLDGTQTEFDTLGEIGGSKYLQEHVHKYLRHHFWAGERTDHADILGDSTVAKGKGMLVESNGVADIPTGDSGNLQPYLVVNYIIKASKKVALDKGNVVDSLTGEDTDSAPSVRAVNGIKGTVLWTNANPTSAFAEQNIQLDLSDYDEIEIVFSTLASGTTRQTFGKVLVGYGAKYITHDWISGVGEALIIRALSTSATGVTFNNAFDIKLSDGTVVAQINDYLVPYKIIGYKTGLFN